jgi:polyisoprenoid-binding protein YceI
VTTTIATLDRSSLAGFYTFDVAHSTLGFVARHAMVTKVRGGFKDFTGTMHIDADNPERSTASVRIVADSISTGNEQRDSHLRSNDFFDMEHFPEIAFESTGIETRGEDRFAVTGDLTIKGVTKPVVFDLEFSGAAVDPWGNTRIGFEGSTTINRKDWGVNWNAPLEAGGVLVSEKVTLTVDISAVRETPAA